MSIFKNLFKKKRKSKLNKDWFLNTFPNKIDSRESIDKLHDALGKFAELDVEDILAYLEDSSSSDQDKVINYIMSLHSNYLKYQSIQLNNLMQMFEIGKVHFEQCDLEKFLSFIQEENKDVKYITQLMERILKVLVH